ncbi:alkane 1-monooxygenase [Aquicoccus sp. SCR17]|nr:alkane 1-monooxygenase [Carideicomes alvinocaridis]
MSDTSRPSPYLDADKVARWSSALPYAASFLLIPLIWAVAAAGGWWLLLIPVSTWYVFAGLDLALGRNASNVDPATAMGDLRWYHLIPVIWVPLQFLTLFGLLAWAEGATHLGALEKIVLFFGMGVLSGTIGINYAHELMHRRSRGERWLADILLAMVLYSHFRSEHLLVHHRHVGTPRDPVTARRGESFYRFYPRVLRQSLRSSFKAEKAMLARKDLPWTDATNPFWRYWALQAAMLILAILIGGWSGLGLFLVQAGTAIWQLELVNYVEHYGLTRKHLGNGRYEPVRPHHSWNADHRASNWLLINLARHSDHHYKPDRSFPLLQTYSASEAPQLPHGYPVMTMAALVPSVWRRMMHPRLQRWREMYYPEITDWRPYNRMKTPPPE